MDILANLKPTACYRAEPTGTGKWRVIRAADGLTVMFGAQTEATALRFAAAMNAKKSSGANRGK